MSEFSASPERLILGALLGFAVLLFLIIKVKIQPFIAIMSSALIIGIAVGMPFSMITDTIAEGVGTTLQTIAILIGLGSMFGAILQVSGGVEVIADTLLKVFGEKRAPWALGITGLIVGMPVFFESGLLILIPVAFGIARKTKKSVFCYSIPLLAGLAIGHAFVPPTPGPVLVAEMLNVQLSYVIMLGIVIGIPAMILAGPVFGKFAGSKFFCTKLLFGKRERISGKRKRKETKICTDRKLILQNSGIGEVFGNFVGALPLPMVLIAFLVAVAVRVSVGSATVSMTMAAGIIASMPMVAGLSQLQLAALTIAIAAGGIAFSHVNDSGFWLSKSLFEVDEKTNLKTWTVMETIVGLVGAVGATIAWFIVS